MPRIHRPNIEGGRQHCRETITLSPATAYPWGIDIAVALGQETLSPSSYAFVRERHIGGECVKYRSWQVEIFIQTGHWGYVWKTVVTEGIVDRVWHGMPCDPARKRTPQFGGFFPTVEQGHGPERQPTCARRVEPFWGAVQVPRQLSIFRDTGPHSVAQPYGYNMLRLFYRSLSDRLR